MHAQPANLIAIKIMNAPQTQTLKTFLLCPCGEKATIGYAFPGSQERGICDLHEKSVEFRRELSPGRAEVASVRRLDAPDPQSFSALAPKPESFASPERELAWERAQNVDLKERLEDQAEELEKTREQLAEAHDALGRGGVSKVDGQPDT